jgi:hypothetical protein
VLWIALGTVTVVAITSHGADRPFGFGLGITQIAMGVFGLVAQAIQPTRPPRERAGGRSTWGVGASATSATTGGVRRPPRARSRFNPMMRAMSTERVVWALIGVVYLAGGLAVLLSKRLRAKASRGGASVHRRMHAPGAVAV